VHTSGVLFFEHAGRTPVEGSRGDRKKWRLNVFDANELVAPRWSLAGFLPPLARNLRVLKPKEWNAPAVIDRSQGEALVVSLREVWS